MVVTEDELRAAVDGLSAYDHGMTDSGIHDERLRVRVVGHLLTLPADERRRVISRVIRDLCLSDEALAGGYGWEDAAELAEWLLDQSPSMR